MYKAYKEGALQSTQERMRPSEAPKGEFMKPQYRGGFAKPLVILQSSYTEGLYKAFMGFMKPLYRVGFPKLYKELHEAPIHRGNSKAPIYKELYKGPI